MALRLEIRLAKRAFLLPFFVVLFSPSFVNDPLYSTWSYFVTIIIIINIWFWKLTIARYFSYLNNVTYVDYRCETIIRDEFRNPMQNYFSFFPPNSPRATRMRGRRFASEALCPIHVIIPSSNMADSMCACACACVRYRIVKFARISRVPLYFRRRCCCRRRRRRRRKRAFRFRGRRTGRFEICSRCKAG